MPAMKWRRSLKISTEMLLAHRLRALLSLTGIVVGIAAVITMAAVGRGSEEKVMDGIRRMGTRLIVVNAGRVALVAGRKRQAAVATTLKVEDAEAIERELGDWISHVAPAHTKKMAVRHSDISLTTEIVGASAEIMPVRGLQTAAGRMFAAQEERALRRVAVVGARVAEELFRDGDAVGKGIRIGKVPFKVIGVLAESGVDIHGVDQDDRILIPLRTALRRLFNLNYLDSIFIRVRRDEWMDAAAERLRDLLRRRHRLKTGGADDFTIHNQQALIRTQQETQAAFRNLTIGVASLSLAVGGVGILAVMLMSVKERIREIGLRRALGARQVDIGRQFLQEAVMLSAGGGFLGLVTGLTAIPIIAAIAGWPAKADWPAVFWAAAISILIGLIFGTIPALKAARANPVDSLRAGK